MSDDSQQHKQPPSSDHPAEQISAAEFTAVYREYVQPLYRYLYSRVGRADLAEELTAQTFLAALEGLPRYRPGNFAGWLFTIARHKAADYFRRQPLAELDPQADYPGPDSDALGALIQAEQKQRLLASIAGLRENERELLRLRYAARLSFPQMAAVLGRGPEAVKKQHYRLLARLKHAMEAADG